MKVLLINISLRPNSNKVIFPIGLGYIATAIHNAGFDFDILDLDANRKTNAEIEKYIKNHEFDVAAMGCIVTGYKHVKKLCEIIKKYKNAPIIVGNSVATSIPKILMEKTKADIGVIGEGDITIVELLRAIENKTSLENVGGIFFRKNSEIFYTEEREIIQNLEELPMINYDLFDMDIYLEKCKYNMSEPYPIEFEKIRSFPINTARGCPYNCSFCYHVFKGKRYRTRPLEHLGKEIRILKEKYGINHLQFFDELSLFTKEQTEKLVDFFINNNLNIYWEADCRAGLFGKDDLELCRKLRKAGCIVLGFSLESADEEILKAMNKHINLEEFKEQVKVLKKAGIVPRTSLVIGYPQETPETIKKTFQICKEAEIYPSSGYLLPQPGTPMYDYALKNNLIKDKEEYLLKMSDRQNFTINFTKMSQEEIESIVKKSLKEISEKLNLGLSGEKLIKTGHYLAKKDKIQNFEQDISKFQKPLDKEIFGVVRKMKILFLYVNPYKNTGIPIGLSYLIPILKSKGHEVDLFETTFYDFKYSDFNISGAMNSIGEEIINDFKKKVEEFEPDVIAVSSASLCLNFALQMIKSLDKKYTTIFGGVGPTVDYNNLIKKNEVDFICIGFGEECLSKLADSLENNKDLKEISNLVYKKDGKIIKNNLNQEIELSSLPVPEWDLFDKRHFERIFKGEVRRWGNFQLSRGCPFNCAYCVNAYYHKELKEGVYRFPVEKIINEMKILSKKHNLEIVRIFDECFGFGDLEPYKKFAEIYEKEINLPTIIETRPETITPETIEILKKIKCISASIGVEAGDENQRKKMLNRFVSNEQIEKCFELLHDAGIRSSSYNIIGFPEDTREKIFKTIKLNKKCKPDFINVFLFCPFPKTQLREYCIKKDCLEIKDVVDYGKKSIIKNPNLRRGELYGLKRTFKYYVKLSKEFWPFIERAERDDEVGKEILKLLEEAVVNKSGY
jgi:radical SAM superfamily enzyme YgiQ (UPF0313 family)